METVYPIETVARNHLVVDEAILTEREKNRFTILGITILPTINIDPNWPEVTDLTPLEKQQTFWPDIFGTAYHHLLQGADKVVIGPKTILRLADFEKYQLYLRIFKEVVRGLLDSIYHR